MEDILRTYKSPGPSSGSPIEIDPSFPIEFRVLRRVHCSYRLYGHLYRSSFWLESKMVGSQLSTIVPNNRELEVYNRSTRTEGIIMVCLKLCPLNKCPDAYVSIDEISKNKRLFVINF